MIMKEILIILTYTFLVGILSIALYKAIPSVKQYLKRVITRKKRVLSIDCSSLEQRISELEKKMAKRHLNDRHAIREEIKNVLMELKK
jgi:hypothetical protein